VATQLHLKPRTLRLWQAYQPVDLVLRGRPLACSPVAVRNDVIAWLDEAGPALSLASLRQGFPEMARAELEDLLVRYRRLWRHKHQHAPHVLHWPVAGVVWAIDFAAAPQPIEGRYPYLLAARDLGSGAQLLWLPVETMTAEVTLAALTSLVAWHGPPLVLKSDNGSAFVADVTQRWRCENGVEWLYSPPRLPQYNGSCEAGIGALKWRTEGWAQRGGRPGQWSYDDVEAARLEGNAGGAEALWLARPRLTEEERRRFAATLAGCREAAEQERGKEAGAAMNEQEQRSLDRVAIRRALVAHGYLLFSRRRIPLPIRPKKVASIS
jgi:transposase InsO family protein